MANGEWRIANGEWRMVSGEWRSRSVSIGDMASDEWKRMWTGNG